MYSYSRVDFMYLGQAKSKMIWINLLQTIQDVLES